MLWSSFTCSRLALLLSGGVILIRGTALVKRRNPYSILFKLEILSLRAVDPEDGVTLYSLALSTSPILYNGRMLPRLSA